MVSRKQRKIDDYKRKVAFKEPRKSILIVCEGQKTEPRYFEALKNNLRLITVNVEVFGEGAAPISVIDRAIELKKNRIRIAKHSLTKTAFDIIYCVFDVEAPQPHESLAQAVNKAKDNSLEVILSNPCFEYWYLLHFRKTSSPFNSSRDVKSKLRVEHPAYRESDTTIIGVIYPKTKDAIKHSKEVINEHHNNEEDLRDCNPSTHIHKIVEYLMTMAQ